MAAETPLSRCRLAFVPKANPRAVRIVTWNIHCGQDDGLPWQRLRWPRRKHSLRTALSQAQPDILCVQEARPGQVGYLEHIMPGHERIGVGRDDGSARGEHCAIYFDRSRFERLADRTFWLDDAIDRPWAGSAFAVRRICSRVRLRDRSNGRVVCIYNTHLPLTERARRHAARFVLQQIATSDRSDVVVLAADFNAPPSAVSRNLFTLAGLADTAVLAGQCQMAKTFHLFGIPLRSLDGMLVGPGAVVKQYQLLDAKPGNVFPSDHFGILVDLLYDLA
jgi:endonuclease/exonuclease/phosphatase family metal-dependent hydrolase